MGFGGRQGGRGGAVGRRLLIGALAATLPALACAPQSRARGARPASRRPTVVLDPGHGGNDPGTISVTGYFEKDVVLEIAQLAAQHIERTRRVRVTLTRTDDDFIALHERVARARAADADLFLSLHADALPNAEMRGASVFTLSERASDKAAAALAAKENRADLIAGIDLSRHTPEVGNILLDLARRQTNNQSVTLARRLVADLGREVPLLHSGPHSAGFAVLKAPDIPSALVELGCLSNPAEDRLLRSTAYQKKLAGILTRSVIAFFDAAAKV